MICILSDTHDNERSTLLALQKIRELQPELVIHCGDLSSPKMLAHFSGLPMRIVFGNTDWDREGFQREAKRLGFEKLEDSIEIACSGKRLFVSHGINMQFLGMVIASEAFDYVFHGHTHQLRDERIGRTRIINPGALQRAAQHTFATLDLEQDLLQIVEVFKA